jgi:hypothetical protein
MAPLKDFSEPEDILPKKQNMLKKQPIVFVGA